MKKLHLYRFDGAQPCRLAAIDPADTAPFADKQEVEPLLEKNCTLLAEEQHKLYAQQQYALLVLLQGLDASGKDGAIRHVFSGLNPQSVTVHSFKQPSSEELGHDYLWRAHLAMPARGEVGVFNRSYYEEVLVVRVHNLLEEEHLPADLLRDIWPRRFAQIVQFEAYLRQNGILPVKIFLHISKDEQRKRLLARLDDAQKNWKFNQADLDARAHWEDYQASYEDAINHTSTPESPWYVVPADKKWYARYLASHITLQALQSLHLQYPTATEEQRGVLDAYRRLLETP